MYIRVLTHAFLYEYLNPEEEPKLKLRPFNLLLGADYMREIDSFLTDLELPETSQFWQYFSFYKLKVTAINLLLILEIAEVILITEFFREALTWC